MFMYVSTLWCAFKVDLRTMSKKEVDDHKRVSSCDVIQPRVVDVAYVLLDFFSLDACNALACNCFSDGFVCAHDAVKNRFLLCLCWSCKVETIILRVAIYMQLENALLAKYTYYTSSALVVLRVLNCVL